MNRRARFAAPTDLRSLLELVIGVQQAHGHTTYLFWYEGWRAGVAAPMNTHHEASIDRPRH